MIYFVRHGETDYTLKHLSQGRIDIPLNELGREQAKRLAKRLKNLDIDIIYSSPLSRVLETAKILNQEIKKELVVDDRLIEMALGKREGQDFYSWDQRDIDAFRRKPEDFGAESLESLHNRVVSVYKEICDSKRNIVIVSHGAVYKALYRYINNIHDTLLKFKTPETCELFVLKS